MSNRLINQQIKQQARTWVRCLNRGLTDSEKPQLIAWLNQNPLHHQALYKATSVFDNIKELNELNGVFPLEKNDRLSGLSAKSLFLIMLLLSLMAILLGQSISTISVFPAENQMMNYQTRIGEQHEFLLPDGSKVTLNTHSKITVNYNKNHRNIHLLYGEALFDVAKDKTRPFTVNTGNKSFTALGTVFNIQKNNELDMELYVSEGQVLVSNQLPSKKLASLIETERAKHDSSMIITDGEKTVIENKQQQATFSLSQAQAEQELSWQQGMLIFSGETLKEALSEVSRYNKIQFEIANDDVSKIKIAGYFKAGDINGLLESLANNFNIKYKFNATNSIQLSKAENPS
ncbi:MULTISPECIES: FecR domain-containing protein [Thalassotalea]|uniref:FecR domain-containing protein n=1 Tax=Thalassotalea castellviae TaxID=3075612 RepID=A0ABU3A0E6_9GAMM|nr:FecR domain-containing protein [Thalassotalea sp. W431]MDT0603651.1 FecR domain-containing protein [Thalassotalea sp. W431]